MNLKIIKMKNNCNCGSWLEKNRTHEGQATHALWCIYWIILRKKVSQFKLKPKQDK